MARPRRHVSTYMLPRIFTGFKLIVKALRRLGFIWNDGLRPRTPGEGFAQIPLLLSRAHAAKVESDPGPGIVLEKKSLTSIPSHGPLPALPSGEEPRAHRVMQAEGRRSRGGRSVASDFGRPPRLQGFSEGAAGAGRQGPKTSAPRPLRAGRARRALKAPRSPLRKGRPAEGPEERWSRRLEASRPMRPGRENRGDATGRPTLKIHFRRPLLAFFQGRGPPRRARPGWIPRARYSQRSPFGRGYVKATSKDCRRRRRRPCRARPRC